jgi:hypothetical protein
MRREQLLHRLFHRRLREAAGMTDRELVTQLRWFCDLADAMGVKTIEVGVVREALDRYGQAGAAPVSLDAWREGKT